MARKRSYLRQVDFEFLKSLAVQAGGAAFFYADGLSWHEIRYIAKRVKTAAIEIELVDGSLVSNSIIPPPKL